MDIKIQVDETSCGEICEERLFRAEEEGRKLLKRNRLVPTSKVKSGTPAANDLAEAGAC